MFTSRQYGTLKIFCVVLAVIAFIDLRCVSASPIDELFDTSQRHPRSFNGLLPSRARRVPGASSRPSVQESCIHGCYNCALTYGRLTYNMAACCRRCRETGSAIVDDGPDQCSSEFIIGDRAALVQAFAKGISVVRRGTTGSHIADEYHAKVKSSHKSRSNIADLW